MFLAELTPVSSVSVDYTCTTNSAMVHWSAVFGAESYEAYAMGDNGTELMCTSQGTSCQISGLHCGQSYEVHVTPISESCKHMLNTTWTTFQTGEIHVSLYQISNLQSPFWSSLINGDHVTLSWPPRTIVVALYLYGSWWFSLHVLSTK